MTQPDLQPGRLLDDDLQQALNFVQHVKSLLKINGRAGVVVPDNVLFEGGAGETVRRKLLHECDVHTLLRLPTGISTRRGSRPTSSSSTASRPARPPGRRSSGSTTSARTATSPSKRRRWPAPTWTSSSSATSRATGTAGKPPGREKRPDGRWRAYAYDELIARDKVSLDLFWLRDESLEDSANLPDPAVMCWRRRSRKGFRAALEQIEESLGDLRGRVDR